MTNQTMAYPMLTRILLMAVALIVGLSPALAEVVETRHGYVVAKREVKGDSNVAKGAIIGGIIGLATAGGKSGSTKAKRTVGGAVLGGVIAGQVDRSKRHYVYTVRFPGGAEQQIAIQEGNLHMGDCAAVTYGTQTTSVNYASDYFCGPEESRRQVEASRSGDACITAKERLLDAEDEDEIARLIKKVQVICETDG